MNDSEPVYLDYNATTPLLPEVVEAMEPYLEEHFGNPSSGHVYGERAGEAVERARRQVAECIGAQPDEIYFTSGGTESNNLALRGVCRAAEEPGHIVTSTVEHSSVRSVCDHLDSAGWRISWVGVDRECEIFRDGSNQAIGDQTDLVSVMLANNETGTIQPVEALAERAGEVGALVHTDAAQAVGKIDVDVDELGVDLLTVAGHKLYAPKGVGALYVRSGTPVEPILHGAGQERGLRPGTENVASIAGLGEACRMATEDGAEQSERIEKLRDRLWEGLREEIPGVALNGHPQRRLPNTLNVRFPGARAWELLQRAPRIAASGGAACHDGDEEASDVLLAMGVPAEEALGSVRFSLGRQTTPDAIERAVAAMTSAYRES